jgi:hypothetical protein
MKKNKPNIQEYIRINDFIKDYYSYLEDNNPMNECEAFSKHIFPESARNKYGLAYFGNAYPRGYDRIKLNWPKEMEEKAKYFFLVGGRSHPRAIIGREAFTIYKVVCVCNRRLFEKEMTEFFFGEVSYYFYNPLSCNLYVHSSHTIMETNLQVQGFAETFEEAYDNASSQYLSMQQKKIEYCKGILDRKSDIEKNLLLNVMREARTFKPTQEVYESLEKTIKDASEELGQRYKLYCDFDYQEIQKKE